MHENIALTGRYHVYFLLLYLSTVTLILLLLILLFA